MYMYNIKLRRLDQKFMMSGLELPDTIDTLQLIFVMWMVLRASVRAHFFLSAPMLTILYIIQMYNILYFTFLTPCTSQDFLLSWDHWVKKLHVLKVSLKVYFNYDSYKKTLLDSIMSSSFCQSHTLPSCHPISIISVTIRVMNICADMHIRVDTRTTFYVQYDKWKLVVMKCN